MLNTHRGNCDAMGPTLKKLQLLWWEFPSEHWDAIGEGSRMGFLSPPPAVFTPNSSMTPEQEEVAGQFCDELIGIGAMGPAPPDDPAITNAPLFCLPKPAQLGEWRVIADCLEGGQNSHMGVEPVHLNRPSHILDQMHTGGHTAVADASKFFCQFPVHPKD